MQLPEMIKSQQKINPPNADREETCKKDSMGKQVSFASFGGYETSCKTLETSQPICSQEIKKGKKKTQ